VRLPSLQVSGATEYCTGCAAENAESFANTQFPMILRRVRAI
jgi:hypothetical protein